MPGALHSFLADDHARLDALLRRGTAEIDGDAYEAFRAGLLRHIAMEEKVLLPELRRAGAADPDLVARLRADHSALAALLVPPPAPDIVTTLRDILAAHNPLEEGPGGLYSTCEHLPGVDPGALLARLRALMPVPVAPHRDSPRIRAQIARLLNARKRHP